MLQPYEAEHRYSLYFWFIHHAGHFAALSLFQKTQKARRSATTSVPTAGVTVELATV